MALHGAPFEAQLILSGHMTPEFQLYLQPRGLRTVPWTIGSGVQNLISSEWTVPMRSLGTHAIH